jgi:hypothetical protein
MYNIYCYALALSAFIAFMSLMYYSFVRPFKSALYNIILIYEEFMTLFCFLILFRYANETSVVDLDTSKAYAKIFAFAVFILTLVPAILALMEFLVSLRHISKICNWKRDYQEEKESFASSDEDRPQKDESDDLLRGEGDSDESLVEKEITLSDSEEDQK